MKSNHATRLLALAALACCALSAQAAVTLPGGDTFLNGDIDDLNYGSVGIADGAPLLYVSQLGGTLPPDQQVLGVPELSYSYSLSGLGTDLAVIEYRISNAVASTKTWTDLRFGFTAQVDGEQVSFLDTVTETWGASKQAGDPDKRETNVWDGSTEGSLRTKWSTGNGASGADGLAIPALCATGCDAELGLQWNLAELKAGETFVVRVGLSDNGKALSSRYFTTTGAGLSESLTVSGVASVIAVPEPQTWAMLIAGIGIVAAIARRQRR